MKAFYLVFLIVFLLGGCRLFFSWDDASKTWVGEPISRFEQQEGPPDRVSKNDDGTTTYKYHLEGIDPSCVQYWVVNTQGIIVDYRYEGHCGPI